jgi:hypothetical protein
MTSITGTDFMNDILVGSQSQQSLAQQIPQYFRGTDGKMHPGGSFKGADGKYHPKGAFYGRDGNYHPQGSFLGNDRKYHLEGSFLGRDNTWHIKGSFLGKDDQYHGPNAKQKSNGTYTEDKNDSLIQMLESNGALT